jgi:4-amino-4-deoxy-L-arabinose transferase-like glycosyltransferase
MAEQGGRKPAGASEGWGDRRRLTTLIVLALALRVWQVWHTEVTSRDSIGYIRIAWQLEHGDWLQVLPNSSQHPLYPLAVLAASVPVRHYHGGDLAVAMQLSAQLASSVASVLLVVPMFYLGRELFDRRTAFWATLLFQCLPATGKMMADGLSEPLFLLCVSTGLLFAARGLRTGSAPTFALAGLASGFAYLTRPEGLVVTGATGLVLLLAQLPARSRLPWRRFLLGGAALTVATLLVAGPYMRAIGGFTRKNTATWVSNPHVLANPPGAGQERAGARLSPAISAQPVVWAVWHGDKRPASEDHSARHFWALTALTTVLVKAFFYVFWLPAALALWWSRGRFRQAPGAWVLALTSLLIALVLYRVARLMGYLGERHMVLILLCGVYWAAAGLLAVVGRLRNGYVSVVVLLVLAGVPLAKTLETLHGDRAGFRAAGCWLAQHACPGDYVKDPYSWAHYYAGRVFSEGCVGVPAHTPPVSYVVLERSNNPHPHLPEVQDALKDVERGRPVRSWPVRRGKELAEVVVYEVAGTVTPFVRVGLAPNGAPLR